jgi:hypothetical protein
MTDISGTWLGTYWQDDQPTRFEASLVQGGSTLSGNILDDGWLGDAIVAGDRLGARVNFTKRYLSGDHDLVSYSGIIENDGDSMQGTWRIGKNLEGRWEAHRKGDDLMGEFMRQMQKQQSLVGAGSGRSASAA